MKFYETHYEEYMESLDKYDLHPELKLLSSQLPEKINELGNFILYGPSGVGKYSQALKIIRKYSPSGLKYDKKITATTEKQSYTYHISDIHYEVDMSLLGCNSKILWHEIFLQIIDIISVNTEKCGMIVCKNIHMIHDELLEIFYSYIQQYSHKYSPIHVIFILISEHISFLPNNILQSCQILNIGRPSKEQYENITSHSIKEKKYNNFINKSSNTTNTPFYYQHILNKKMKSIENEKVNHILNTMDTSCILNSKEIKSFSFIHHIDELPKDIFNVICDNIIQEMINHKNLSFTGFRDSIYDILIYNLDVTECICYIFYYFIHHQYLSPQDNSNILNKIHHFLKYYNNNYRPIYHIESILFYIITKVHRTS